MAWFHYCPPPREKELVGKVIVCAALTPPSAQKNVPYTLKCPHYTYTRNKSCILSKQVKLRYYLPNIAGLINIEVEEKEKNQYPRHLLWLYSELISRISKPRKFIKLEIRYCIRLDGRGIQ